MSLMPHDEPLHCSALQPLRTLNVFLSSSRPGLMSISVITSAAGGGSGGGGGLCVYSFKKTLSFLT